MSEGKKILLADDEPLIRHLTRKTLAGQNFQIFEASNGFEALLLAREHTADLIVLDVRIPGKSGIEVCRILRSETATSRTPIILLAGDPAQADVQAGVQAGANHFFTKPFSPLQLIQKIQEFLSDGTPPVGGLSDPAVQVEAAASRRSPVERKSYDNPDDLRYLEREQLLLYAGDLSTVYHEEQKKREELKAAYEKLREMEKMKDVFVSLVSHELRTPLSIIKGYVSLMDQILSSAEVGGELQRFTQSIQKAANRLEDLIKELLDFSKMKHGIVPMERKEVHLPSLVGVLLQDFAGAAQAKEIRIEVSPPMTSRPIKADPVRLKEAISHILGNAIAFTNPTGRINIDFVEEGLWVRLRIQDTGVGIPSGEQEKIFVPFYQVEDYLTRSVEGLGLGLSIARHIVEDHGGTIGVDSEPGKGSTFILNFPRTYGDAREMVGDFTDHHPDKLKELSTGLVTTERQLLEYAQELSELYSAEQVRSQRLEENLHEMERTYLQTIAQVAKMVDSKDAYKGDHTDRVTHVACCIARSHNPGILEDRNFTYALLLHDLGKIGVAEDLLQKADRLTDEEWAVVRSHVEIGTKMLEDIHFLSPAMASVRSHHERWDGRGYPDGLRGEEIPLVARIIAIADAFEAMTSDRPYRKGLVPEEARREIQRGAGTQFDPKLVEAFSSAWDDIARHRDTGDSVMLSQD